MKYCVQHWSPPFKKGYRRSERCLEKVKKNEQGSGKIHMKRNEKDTVYFRKKISKRGPDKSIHPVLSPITKVL